MAYAKVVYDPLVHLTGSSVYLHADLRQKRGRSYKGLNYLSLSQHVGVKISEIVENTDCGPGERHLVVTSQHGGGWEYQPLSLRHNMILRPLAPADAHAPQN